MAAWSLRWISQLLPDLGGWCFKFYGSINPDERMILPSVNYVLPNPIWRHPIWLHFDTDQVHDYDWSLISMAKFQLLLNILRLCFKLHGSIYPMESVKLPSVNYFFANPRWRHPRWLTFVILRPITTLSLQLHSISRYSRSQLR